MHIPATNGMIAPTELGGGVVRALSVAAADAMTVPSLIDTFEADDALHAVFGITSAQRQQQGLDDMPVPEQVRLRRIFDKSSHHGGGELDHSLFLSAAAAVESSSCLQTIRPSAKLEDLVYQYRIESKRAQKLNCVRFRSMGGFSVKDLTDTISGELMDDLLDDLTGELDSIFSDYAEKFLREV
jgi:hypothetical protein